MADIHACNTTERNDYLSEKTTDRSSSGEDAMPQYQTPSPGLKQGHTEQPNKGYGATCTQGVANARGSGGLTPPSSILTQSSSGENFRSIGSPGSGVLAAQIHEIRRSPHCSIASNTKSNGSYGNQESNISVGNSSYHSTTRTSLSNLHSAYQQMTAMDATLPHSASMRSDQQTGVVNTCLDDEPPSQAIMEGYYATPRETGGSDCCPDGMCVTSTTPMLGQVSVETG